MSTSLAPSASVVTRVARAAHVARIASMALATVAAIGAAACRDISRFSSAGDHFEGSVVKGAFVRNGVDVDSRLCLSLDADHLQDAPGKLSSSDGRFRGEPLRPIPQLWHDPLSTMSFGEGREKNLMYVTTPSTAFDDGGESGEVLVIVSLMASGTVEVRMLRGAPSADGAQATTGAANLFAVYQLDRVPGACSF
jgi:hypothetical protein